MIEVGEYVRTDKGTIGKIEDVEWDLLYRITTMKPIYKHWISKNQCYTEEVIKHSKNIIDLIKEGDYVNGQKVIEVDSCKGAMREVYVEGQNPEKDCGLYFEQIETVVTKEQFANIEYRLEENK